MADSAKERADKLKEEGNKFFAEGHYVQATEAYSGAIEIFPTAVYYGNRAFSYLKMENYGLAISDSDEAIKLDSDYVKAYYRRASANMALGKHKLSVKDLRHVVKTHPNSADARTKLKVCEKILKESAFASAIMQETEDPLCARIAINEIGIDASYDGPRLEEDGVVTMEFAVEAIERFKAQKLIAKRYLAAILQKAYVILKETPTLMRISVGEKGFTVCGDTHGQFYDLLHIFEINGLPSKDNPYLFNGDFVDRGSFSLEVITTLLAIKVACPEAVYLTRGNHESKNMNKIYGFEGEVKHKYDASIMTMFAEVFCWLPLCATLNEKVFVVHGGLLSADGVTLKDIEKIDRNREPPDSGLMSDLMWSDPQPFQGRSASKRGVGMSFGPDVTKAFLELNHLELLVRSHEVKDEGYLIEHEGKCITVFSAPNYCDQMGNKGAFIRFGPEMTPKMTQFESSPHPAVRPMAYASSFLNFGL